MADQNDIFKYLKVKALAERGAPGERSNAQRILAKMESDDPGLKGAAASFAKSANPPPQVDNTPSQPPPWGHSPWPTAGWNAPGNWENIFQYAQTAFHSAVDITQKIANATLGTALANYVESSTRMTRAGNVLMTFKMTWDLYEALKDLNPVQQAAFRAAMHERLNEELDILFDPSDEETQS